MVDDKQNTGGTETAVRAAQLRQQLTQAKRELENTTTQLRSLKATSTSAAASAVALSLTKDADDEAATKAQGVLSQFLRPRGTQEPLLVTYVRNGVEEQLRLEVQVGENPQKGATCVETVGDVAQAAAR